MKVLVLSYGNIGYAVARDMAERTPSVEVVVAGKNKNRVEEVIAAVKLQNLPGLNWTHATVMNSLLP
jgi:saccharopine dehydrogenase-like NADP-dependent oxidoreductase